MFNFTDNGLILGLSRHGENGFILSVFTENHGRYTGLLRTKNPPLIGTLGYFHWQARLEEHLGTFKVETKESLSFPYLDDKKRLACLSSLYFLLNATLPERESYTDFYADVLSFIRNLSNENFLSSYVKMELKLLRVLGFGLDLSKCAGGGNPEHLAYVSPKTGKAVSLEKGEPFRQKLLILPPFLWKNVPATPKDIQDGLILTGFFLSRHLTKLPVLRETLL